MFEQNTNYGDMSQGIDRITDILRRQSAPVQSSPLQPEASQLPINILQAINYSGRSYPGAMSRSNLAQDVQAYEINSQNQQLNQQKALLQSYEAKLKLGDAQAQALDDKIKLFTGNDPEGKALFLQGLHDDPEPIDASNSYQVMTKLAAIKKKSGYESPDLALEKRKQLADILYKEAAAGKNNAAANKDAFNFGPSSEIPAIRNNNPGNMRPTGATSGFQQFSSPEEGVAAMRNDLLGKINGTSKAMAGKEPTLVNLITTWAPPTENDTAKYIKNVSLDTGISPDQILTPQDVDKLMPAIIKQEGGKTSFDYFSQINGAASQPEERDSAAPKPIFKGGAPYTAGLEKGYQWAMGPDGAYVSMKIPAVDAAGNATTNPITQMSTTIGGLKSAYDELHKLGEDLSTQNSYLTNKKNQLKLSEGLSIGGVPIIPSGQSLMKGTKSQAIVDKIGAGISGLLLDIKSASGAGAKQFDSDKDVEFMKKQATSPTNSYEANLEILNRLSLKYTGKPLQDSSTEAQAAGGWSVRQVN